MRTEKTMSKPLSYAEQLVRQWELADPRDRWRHTGEPTPPASARNAELKPTK
jgi:hypothetical protein